MIKTDFKVLGKIRFYFLLILKVKTVKIRAYLLESKKVIGSEILLLAFY